MKNINIGFPSYGVFSVDGYGLSNYYCSTPSAEQIAIEAERKRCLEVLEYLEIIPKGSNFVDAVNLVSILEDKEKLEKLVRILNNKAFW